MYGQDGNRDQGNSSLLIAQLQTSVALSEPAPRFPPPSCHALPLYGVPTTETVHRSRFGPTARLGGDRDLDLDAGLDVDDDGLDDFGGRVQAGREALV